MSEEHDNVDPNIMYRLKGLGGVPQGVQSIHKRLHDEAEKWGQNVDPEKQVEDDMRKQNREFISNLSEEEKRQNEASRIRTERERSNEAKSGS
jgi:hypothetical protein